MSRDSFWLSPRRELHNLSRQPVPSWWLGFSKMSQNFYFYRNSLHLPLFELNLSWKTWGNGHKLNALEQNSLFLWCGDGEMLEQVAQRSCRVSIQVNTQNPTGKGLEKPVVIRIEYFRWKGPTMVIKSNCLATSGLTKLKHIILLLLLVLSWFWWQRLSHRAGFGLSPILTSGFQPQWEIPPLRGLELVLLLQSGNPSPLVSLLML